KIDMRLYMKTKSGKHNLSNDCQIAVSQLCGMMFQRANGVQVTEVPFQGTAPAMNALLGGQVDVLCDQTTQTVPQIQAGNVKLHGVTTRKRVKVLPGAPTLAEQGLKDFEVVVWHGIYAPKGTPKPIIDKMNAAVRRAQGPGRDEAHGRSRRRDRAGRDQHARGLARVAEVGDRPLGPGDP